jgi:predicted ATPase/class 3 adenylate cyclase
MNELPSFCLPEKASLENQKDLALLFSDIENSTLLVQSLGSQYPVVISIYRSILRDCISQFGGMEVDTAGDGFFAVFSMPIQALQCSRLMLNRLLSENWPCQQNVRSRFGIHCGTVTCLDQGYVGLNVHRAARICDAANGLQIVVSKAIFESVLSPSSSIDTQFRDLGVHRLKGLRYPEHLFDVFTNVSLPASSALRSIDYRPNNLPAFSPDLVGRDDDLIRLQQMLLNTDVRLVTVTGTGGIGKTSLCLNLCRMLVDRFTSGVYFVDLSSLYEPEFVASEIGEVLGVHEESGDSIVNSLCFRLSGADLLLFLDNFEHLLEARDLIDTLLNRCKKLKILLTSREPTYLHVEEEYRLLPLAMPNQNEGVTTSSAISYPSLCLFTKLAQKQIPSFLLTSSNLNQVVELCRQLDGLPLALELAAARLSLLSLDEIIVLLASSSSILKGGKRFTSRQQSLQATIEWSYGLLSEVEKALIKVLSVFRGGFTVKHASSLVAKVGIVIDDILDSLKSLLDKSLLLQQFSDGTPRLDMFETMRSYFYAGLAADYCLASIRDSHAMIYLDIAEEIAPTILRKNQINGINILLEEQANMRAALNWILEAKLILPAQRFIRALLWFWISRGLFAEGKTWFEKAIQLTYNFEHIDDKLPICLLWSDYSLFLMMSGDYSVAHQSLLKAKLLFQDNSVSDDFHRVSALLGVTQTIVCNDPSGLSLLQMSIEAYELNQNLDGQAFAETCYCAVCMAMDNYYESKDFHLATLDKLKQLGNVYWTGHILNNLARIQVKLNEINFANTALIEALEIGQIYDYPIITALAVAGFSQVLMSCCDYEAAAKLIGCTIHILNQCSVTFEPPDQAIFEQTIKLVKEKTEPGLYEKLVLDGGILTIQEAKEMAIARTLYIEDVSR